MSVTTVKKEVRDNGYAECEINKSAACTKYGTPMAFSPKGVESSTNPQVENQDFSPAAKRTRCERCDGQPFSQNGHHSGNIPHCRSLSTKYEHYEGSHAGLMLNGFLSLRLRKELLDIVLLAEGREIPCHKASHQCSIHYEGSRVAIDATPNEMKICDGLRLIFPTTKRHVAIMNEIQFAVGKSMYGSRKIVLCSVSKYFADLFLTSSSKYLNQNVIIRETSYEIMLQLVDFAYTARIDITDENMELLFSAASCFGFTTVCEACITVLRQKLSPATCIAIKRFADKQNCRELAAYADRFACENFEEVAECDEFKRIRVKELLHFISSSDLNASCEEQVYEAVMRWVRFDETARQCFLPKILEHVRLPLVKPQFLLDVVQPDPLIKVNKDCEAFLNEARRFQLLADQRPLMQSCRTQPRRSWHSQKSEVLVVVGGLDTNKTAVPNCLYFDFPDSEAKEMPSFKNLQYDPPENFWCLDRLSTLKLDTTFENNLCKIGDYNQIKDKRGFVDSRFYKVCQTAYSVATVNNNIFVTGGAFHSPYRDVWMYIPSLKSWQQVALMIEARYLHSSAALDDHLYVIGGHNGRRRLSSVEKYNPDSNSWSTMKPMLKELSSTCSVATDGYLYVIGGAHGPSADDVVCDVQYFNPVMNIWKTTTPLPRPERGALAAALNGTIYVMGQQRRVCAYNRQSNVWVYLRNTNGGHLHGAATIHRGKLFVAGGLHGNSFINGTVEMYDQLHDNWQVVGTLPTPVYAQGLVCIYKERMKKRPS